MGIDEISRVLGALQASAEASDRQRERLFSLFDELRDETSIIRQELAKLAGLPAELAEHIEREERIIAPVTAAAMMAGDYGDTLAECRSMLDTYRAIKRGAWQTLGKIGMALLLTMIAVALGFNGKQIIDWVK